MQAAVSAPRGTGRGPNAHLRSLPGPVIDGLRLMGHAVTVCEDDLGGGQFARPNGTMVDERRASCAAASFSSRRPGPSVSDAD